MSVLGWVSKGYCWRTLKKNYFWILHLYFKTQLILYLMPVRYQVDWYFCICDRKNNLAKLLWGSCIGMFYDTTWVLHSSYNRFKAFFYSFFNQKSLHHNINFKIWFNRLCQHKLCFFVSNNSFFYIKVMSP